MTFMRGSRTRGAVLAAGIAAAIFVTAPAQAVGPNGTKFAGETDQGREIKLITDPDGLVKRGAFSVLTQCTGQFKPFSAEISFDRPLKRSSKRGFRDAGNRLDTDGTFSGRYKYDIKGNRKTSKKFKGKIDLEIVFRKNDKKYTTCTAEDVAYKVKRSDQGARAAA